MTKSGAGNAIPTEGQFQVALAHDAGTTKGGLYGLTDLLTYANDFAARSRNLGTPPPVRITHWYAGDDGAPVSCTYDTWPSSSHAPSVVIIPNNHLAILDPKRDSPLLDWLRTRHAEGAVLAAVCGGVFILAKTGLLTGRQATTHWSFSSEFSDRFPDVLLESDHMVIEYADVVTAGGALAWADLGLRLVERFLGPMVTHDTARYMNLDPPGREQRFYSGFEPRTKHGDAAILKAQHWLATQREHPVAVADVARQAGLEPRTFLRRFVQATGMKPSEYLQRLRMSRAREMLEFSRSSVEAVAAGLGYRDVRGFHRVFRSIVGLTPSEYRRRFSRVSRQTIYGRD